jgi:hypothetical protein
MLLLLWIALWLAGSQVRPASRPDAVLDRASIQGTVIRAGAAAARQPITDARVELRPGNVSVMTGADGAFTFRNLAPGRYTISITRDGFIPQEDRPRGLTVSGLSVTVNAGQTLKDIVLPMIPTPVIIGKVFDPIGEPLAAALVRAYLREYTPYGTQLKVVSKGMTNDLGEFRLFGLNFGAYFVSAGNGDRERAAALGKTRLSPNVSKADDGYATIFFNGAEDISRAQPVYLAPGLDSGALDIILRDSTRFTIRGRVLPVAAAAKIVLAPKGSDLSEADYFIEPNSSGAFEIRGVSPGSYLLRATAAAGAMSSDVLAINVTDRDIDGVPLTLEDTMSISGGIFVDRSLRSSLAGLHVKLVRSGTEFVQRIDAPAAPDGAFMLSPVDRSGEYDVVVEPLPPGLYVRSMSSGGRSILQGKSRLLPNQWLQIALAESNEALEVHVSKGSDPAAGAQVVLIPEPVLRRRADRYITAFSSETGDLRLSGVPAGRYTAYAFEQIERGAYYAFAFNPASENRFRDRAATVIVGENGAKSIELRVIPAAETAGGLQ